MYNTQQLLQGQQYANLGIGGWHFEALIPNHGWETFVLRTLGGGRRLTQKRKYRKISRKGKNTRRLTKRITRRSKRTQRTRKNRKNRRVSRQTRVKKGGKRKCRRRK
jgi:hypothetical protein